MDNSKEFQLMLDKVIESEPLDFKNFDRTKNVQDQLQEMVLPDPNAKDAWGDPFEDDGKDDHVFWLFLKFSEALQERKRSQQTGEQLWLRFVMKEKYNKTWNGEKWNVIS